MEIGELLQELGYDTSPNCLQGNELEHAPDYGHVFRRAKETVNLAAVYSLRSQATENKNKTLIPVTYVCKAASLGDADGIHRLVWNQNVIPFLIVLAPQGIRIYSGFDLDFNKSKTHANQYLDELPESDFSNVSKALASFSAESIDNGTIWTKWGDRVHPQQRVEWRLLEDLHTLEEGITKAGLNDSALVHALIGKFVFLYYLRHRNILSDDRLALWNLTWDDVAGRSAKLSSFTRLCRELDERLNGSIFPLTERKLRDIGSTVLQRIASVFAGDSAAGQMHLDFDAYDFSHIPIETLSVIYEQFLHQKKTPSGSTAGKEQAAYYTPIPVVNFMIDRMDELKPLHPGMRVLDFACGSGAFLVQCYRKLIEDQWRSAPNHRKPRPGELKELLVKHIFGLDVDAEACRVAELSLLLTLLDYVEPPDLLTANGNEHRFKLPTLTDTNIVEANAFDDAQEITLGAKTKGFDWIIGNPPWKDIRGKSVSSIDRPVLNWMTEHKTDKPTGGNQTAEAFAWRTQDFAGKDALAGLLIPAMTLFKSESKGFRQKFFAINPPSYVANFANLAEVLFAGRSRVPAAALIFAPGRGLDHLDLAEKIPIFTPLVANQEATRPRQMGKRIDSWSIAVDQGEVRSLNRYEIQSGDAITWKLAAWGSHLDQRLLRHLSRLPTLGSWADDIGLTCSEGPPLRGKAGSGGYSVEHHPELAGHQTLVTAKLSGHGRLFTFPPDALRIINPDETYVPKRSGFKRPESVCRAPHVLVSAARNWAVFWDKYLVVPARQIGIAGPKTHSALLKALALYLNADVVLYHEFFASTERGVTRERSTLTSLRATPIPAALAAQEPKAIASWGALYDDLVDVESSATAALSAAQVAAKRRQLLEQLNKKMNDALELGRGNSQRVSDFVNVLIGLEAGKIEDRAGRPPSEGELQDYTSTLKQELDAFVGSESRALHGVQVWRDEQQKFGVIQINLGRGADVTIHPRSVGARVTQKAADLRQQLESHFSQWRYFNRNLNLFFKDRIYLFKPMQRFHWLQSQAVLDAGEIISLVIDHTWGVK